MKPAATWGDHPSSPVGQQAPVAPADSGSVGIVTLLTLLRCLAGGGLHDARAGLPTGRIGGSGESRHRARCGRGRGRARARPCRVPNVIAQATASRRGAVCGCTVPPCDCARAPTPLAPRLRPFHSPAYPPLLTPARLLHTSARCPLTCFFMAHAGLLAAYHCRQGGCHRWHVEGQTPPSACIQWIQDTIHVQA